MIQQQTILRVSDNSGAKTVRCFKVLGGFKKICFIMSELNNISLLKQNRKEDGSEILFKGNAVVLLNKQGNPIGTKFGTYSKMLKKKNFRNLLVFQQDLSK
jgi:large subunit ribosomal protein L14